MVTINRSLIGRHDPAMSLPIHPTRHVDLHPRPHGQWGFFNVLIDGFWFVEVDISVMLIPISMRLAQSHRNCFYIKKYGGCRIEPIGIFRWTGVCDNVSTSGWLTLI